jgi:hypothetical protein
MLLGSCVAYPRSRDASDTWPIGNGQTFAAHVRIDDAPLCNGDRAASRCRQRNARHNDVGRAIDVCSARTRAHDPHFPPPPPTGESASHLWAQSLICPLCSFASAGLPSGHRFVCGSTATTGYRSMRVPSTYHHHGGRRGRAGCAVWGRGVGTRVMAHLRAAGSTGS